MINSNLIGEQLDSLIKMLLGKNLEDIWLASSIYDKLSPMDKLIVYNQILGARSYDWRYIGGVLSCVNGPILNRPRYPIIIK